MFMQMVDHGRMLYFLDGAHTEESVLACRSWFTVASRLASLRQPSAREQRIAIFNSKKGKLQRLIVVNMLRLHEF
jgi:hypothetical protein